MEGSTRGLDPEALELRPVRSGIGATTLAVADESGAVGWREAGTGHRVPGDGHRALRRDAGEEGEQEKWGWGEGEVKWEREELRIRIRYREEL